MTFSQSTSLPQHVTLTVYGRCTKYVDLSSAINWYVFFYFFKREVLESPKFYLKKTHAATLDEQVCINIYLRDLLFHGSLYLLNLFMESYLFIK